MAYEIVGLEPKSHLGICVRMNIWSWPEFLEILFSVGAISLEEKTQMILNDCGIVFDEKRCAEISIKISPVVEYLRSEGECAESSIYEKFFIKNIEGKKNTHIRGNEVILAYLFIVNCGGFYLR